MASDRRTVRMHLNRLQPTQLLRLFPVTPAQVDRYVAALAESKAAGKSKSRAAASAASSASAAASSLSSSSSSSMGASAHDERHGKRGASATAAGRGARAVVKTAGVPAHAQRLVREQILDLVMKTHMANGMSVDDLANAELTYVQSTHTSRKSWRSLRLVYLDSDTPKVDDNESNALNALAPAAELAWRKAVPPHALQAAIHERMNVFFPTHVLVHHLPDAAWIRLQMREEGRLQPYPDSTVILVYYPHTRMIASQPMKQFYKNYLLQTLIAVLGCARIDELALTTPQLDSLAAMSLHNDAQGPYSALALNQTDQHPLARRRRKVSAQGREEFSNMDTQVIVQEDEEETQQVKRVALEQFGPNAQPVLKEVALSSQTLFQGTSLGVPFSIPSKPFRCKIVLRGPSVIEGLKELTQRGMAAAQLPPYLANLHSTGMNSMSILEDGSVAGVPVHAFPSRGSR
ncbi:hypothetical protein CAOG_03957 [Capsaspora owczarzaki ATCC 30864]|uniref:Centromere protein Chl4/mis15/CENP-N n=1 Tax=Capsaspora owczarzaki (strain ATCC 30864) TaxID=595528 RepID=A0A0D2WPA2_CAPO3|nr:hypothetical protein CAOG_03957 [Capsaspora owczarzaki ATCC 30864]KJE93125.1 hypothetical protein CAOG_003957 [Capsaspora owczarzaki ATCC 30864]|eukprot:XP_004363685.2 hypothetical protein CAOG_03957 [Capsaspora owczarzaki ATCC 30864]